MSDLQRLDRRGEDTPEVIATRMANARTEVAQARHFDFVIINSLFETALFDLNGTATRKQALRVFLVLLLALVSLVLVRAFLPSAGRFADPVVGMIVVWWFATMVRRLHDAGHSGGWALFLLVPYVGVLVAIWVLMLRGDRPFNNSHAGLRAAGTAGLVLMAVLSPVLGPGLGPGFTPSAKA
mgnify:CR=1 FL=1